LEGGVRVVGSGAVGVAEMEKVGATGALAGEEESAGEADSAAAAGVSALPDMIIGETASGPLTATEGITAYAFVWLAESSVGATH